MCFLRKNRQNFFLFCFSHKGNSCDWERRGRTRCIQLRRASQERFPYLVLLQIAPCQPFQTYTLRIIGTVLIFVPQKDFKRVLCQPETFSGLVTASESHVEWLAWERNSHGRHCFCCGVNLWSAMTSFAHISMWRNSIRKLESPKISRRNLDDHMRVSMRLQKISKWTCSCNASWDVDSSGCGSKMWPRVMHWAISGEE